MERDSFIFYRSFYEAIRELPNAIQLEVFTTIMEYALYGRLPDDLKPFAAGIFTLMRPIIDNNNTRFANGRKGGRKPRTPKLQLPDDMKQPPADTAYDATFQQEVDRMRADNQLRAAVCKEFSIPRTEFDRRLDRFLEQCLVDAHAKNRLGHDSYHDCTSHLRFWMPKAYPAQRKTKASPATQRPDASDYTYSGGFGSKDS